MLNYMLTRLQLSQEIWEILKYLMNLRINEFYVGLLCFINIMDTNVGHIAHFVVNLI